MRRREERDGESESERSECVSVGRRERERGSEWEGERKRVRDRERNVRTPNTTDDSYAAAACVRVLSVGASAAIRKEGVSVDWYTRALAPSPTAGRGPRQRRRSHRAFYRLGACATTRFSCTTLRRHTVGPPPTTVRQARWHIGCIATNALLSASFFSGGVLPQISANTFSLSRPSSKTTLCTPQLRSVF